METRFVQQEDLPEFAEWWEARDSTLALAVLPKLGICCENDDGLLVAVAWVYEMECTSGKVGYIGWMTTNPYMPVSSYYGMQEVMSSIHELREDRGWIMLFATTDSTMLDRILLSQNFEIGDTGVTQYVSLDGN